MYKYVVAVHVKSVTGTYTLVSVKNVCIHVGESNL